MWAPTSLVSDPTKVREKAIATFISNPDIYWFALSQGKVLQDAIEVTLKLALNCALMGMLVFGTLHTNNEPKTIDRIIDAFPAEEQSQIRVMVSSCLSCVVSQLLCKRQPKGRITVHEILLKHDALSNTIRSGNISAIRGIIERSAVKGMTTVDASIMKALKAGHVTGNEAYMKASDNEKFKQFVK